MIYSQNIVKYSFEWSWTTPKKWKNNKILKIIDVIITITIFYTFIYLFLKIN
jgi:hypothetical protein